MNNFVFEGGVNIAMLFVDNGCFSLKDDKAYLAGLAGLAGNATMMYLPRVIFVNQPDRSLAFGVIMLWEPFLSETILDTMLPQP